MVLRETDWRPGVTLKSKNTCRFWTTVTSSSHLTFNGLNFITLFLKKTMTAPCWQTTILQWRVPQKGFRLKPFLWSVGEMFYFYRFSFFENFKSISPRSCSIVVANSLTSIPFFSVSLLSLLCLFFYSTSPCCICFHFCTPAVCPHPEIFLHAPGFGDLLFSCTPSTLPFLFSLLFPHPSSPSSFLILQILSVVAVTWSPQMIWNIQESTGRWGTALAASPMWAWCIRRSTATRSVPPRAWRLSPTCTRLTWNARGTLSWIISKASTNSSSSSSNCSIHTTAPTTTHHHPHPPTPAWGAHQSALHENR